MGRRRGRVLTTVLTHGRDEEGRVLTLFSPMGGRRREEY